MSRSIFSQILKFVCKFRPNYISSVAEVLKSFDENYSGSFHWFDEEVHPKTFCAFKQKSTFSEALRQVQRNSERRHIVKTVCYKKPFSMLQRIVQCVTKYVTMSKYRSLFYREYSRLAPGMLQSTDKFVTKYVKIESLFDQWSCRESLFVFLLFWYTIFRGIIWQLIWYFW